MTLRIALLHLAPIAADVAHNRRLVEAAVAAAAGAGAEWMITPELCVSGFTFADRIGTDWILEQPDPWMTAFRERVARLGVAVFLSHPERDARTGALHNSVFVIGPDGSILGAHRKINTLRVGSEAWSTPGDEVGAIDVAPVGPVGVLVCADAYSPWIAKSLAAEGARLLVSSAAWAPGLHGPADHRWTEEFQEDLYRHQIAMMKRIRVWRGLSPWILTDFQSPRRPLPKIQDGWNRKGLVSDRGEKKKAFFVLQSFYASVARDPGASKAS